MNEDIEYIATGFVRPKTTSLFFDKVWIPSLLRFSQIGEKLGYDIIPDEVRFIENAEEWVFKNEYCRPMKNVTVSNEKNEIVSLINNINKYPRMILNNRPYNTVEENISMHDINNEFQLDLDIDGYDLFHSMYRYSENRNRGIQLLSENFKQIYGINITPVFFAQTQFEQYMRQLAPNDGSKLNNVMATAICINYIPEIIEDSLDWQQVLDLRKDSACRKSFKRFANWSFLNLESKSEKQIVELLDKELDDYKAALKKHGILTTVGSFTSVMSAVSTIIGVVESVSVDTKFSAGISISSALITFTSKQIVDYWQTKRNPIAFIYSVCNMG